ncbi:MAG: hypothetical protein V5B40_10990 [Candidatus Accumulibacter meliphilus]
MLAAQFDALDVASEPGDGLRQRLGGDVAQRGAGAGFGVPAV